MACPRFILFCLLNLLVGSTVLGWNPVSRAQFQSTVDNGDLALVAFIAPSTEGTKDLEPEWAAAAARSPKPLISIDCTIEASLCKENEVASYPAIRLLRGRERMTRYRGPRKASAIVSFMNRSILPPVSILDKKNITSFRSVHEVAFIAYLHPEDVDTKLTFNTIATRNNDKSAFGIVYDASLAKADSLPFPSIVCYRSQEEEMEILPGKPGIRELQRFLETATAPLIGEMTRRNEMEYLKSGKSLVYIFALTEDERSNFREMLRPLAKKYKDYLSFVTIDAIEYGPMAQALGFRANAFPALVVQNPILGQVFLHDQTRVITPDAVESFVLDIVQGKVQPNGKAGEGRAHTEL